MKITDVLPRITIVITALCGFLGCSCAQELDAPPQAMVDAAHAACSRYALYGHDLLRQEPGDDPLPPVPSGPTPYRPSDDKLLDIYNSFNLRGTSEVLGAYADRAAEDDKNHHRYSDAQCKVLVPTYALAKTVLTLNVPPLRVTFGGLIDRCRTDGIVHLCLRRSLVVIPARCDLPASADRFAMWCLSPALTDSLSTEVASPMASPRTDSPSTTSTTRDDF